jgi:hypothetical protein
MVAAVFGCIFGILGIFTIGAIFVPLAALCTAIAFLTGVFARRVSVLLMSMVSGCVTVIAFVISPSAWLLFGGILLVLSGAARNDGNNLNSAAQPIDSRQAMVSNARSPSYVATESDSTGQATPAPSQPIEESAPAQDVKESSVSVIEPPVTGAKETAIDLRCTPPPMFGGNAKDAVVESYVSVQGSRWMVKHVLASGLSVDRGMQYGLHEASTPNLIAWEGNLIQKPQLKMRGEIVNINGVFSYREQLYDVKRGDTIVVDTKFNCQTNVNIVSPFDKPEIHSGRPLGDAECAMAKTMVFPTADLAKAARLSCERR